MHRVLMDPCFREDDSNEPFFDSLESRNYSAPVAYGPPLPALAETNFAGDSNDLLIDTL